MVSERGFALFNPTIVFLTDYNIGSTIATDQPLHLINQCVFGSAVCVVHLFVGQPSHGIVYRTNLTAVFHNVRQITI